MSCFEKSLFKRHQSLAYPEVIINACQQLGLKHRRGSYGAFIYDENNELLMVVDMGHIYYNNESDRALIGMLEREAEGLAVAFGDERWLENARKVAEWERQMQERETEQLRAAEAREKRRREAVLRRLNVGYARQAIVDSFESRGFFHQSDHNFRPSGNAIDRFFMCAYTTLNELPEDRQTSIEFTIMSDGSIISDSNYIPQDVHEQADEAMEELEKIMGFARREGIEIKRKKIPLQYETKAYCSIQNRPMREVFEMA